MAGEAESERDWTMRKNQIDSYAEPSIEDAEKNSTRFIRPAASVAIAPGREPRSPDAMGTGGASRCV